MFPKLVQFHSTKTPLNSWAAALILDYEWVTYSSKDWDSLALPLLQNGRLVGS